MPDDFHDTLIVVLYKKKKKKGNKAVETTWASPSSLLLERFLPESSWTDSSPCQKPFCQKPSVDSTQDEVQLIWSPQWDRSKRNAYSRTWNCIPYLSTSPRPFTLSMERPSGLYLSNMAVHEGSSWSSGSFTMVWRDKMSQMVTNPIFLRYQVGRNKAVSWYQSSSTVLHLCTQACCAGSWQRSLHPLPLW